MEVAQVQEQQKQRSNTKEDKSKRYKKNEKLGEGAFSIVYRGIDSVTGTTVAIKKVRISNIKDGVSFVSLREIKLLQELKHPNVIELIDVFNHNENINLVFECMETDLERIIKDRNIILGASDIKSYMQMLLRGVEYCHKHWVLHRDLKPSNLLVDKTGQLKLADFGLARIFGSPDRQFTHYVVTRWYRAPELLFGAKQYGEGIDMWSVGCIFAELMLRTPYLPGDSDIDQLGKMFAALGTPNEDVWPGMKELPDYVEFNPCPTPPLKQLFSAASDDALDLLSKFLKFDPNMRISASEALKHGYFSNAPAPTPQHSLQLPNIVKQIEVATYEQQENTKKRKLTQNGDDSGVRKKLNL